MSVVVCEKPVAPEPAIVRIAFYRPLCAPADGLSERFDAEPPLKEGSVECCAVCTNPCGKEMDWPRL